MHSSSIPTRTTHAPATQFAYAITGAPPFFRIPPAWARTFRDAARLAPEHDDDEGTPPGALGLASSTLADKAALAQGAGGERRTGRANRGDLLKAIDRSQRQVDTVRERLAAWKTIAPRLTPAREWLTRRAAALAAADQDELERWAPVIAQQQDILFEASGEAIAVLDLAGRSGAGTDAPAQEPVRDVLAAYATAIGQSHLVDSARTALAGARAKRANLPIALSRLTVRDSGQAASELAHDTGRTPLLGGPGALEVQQQIERDQLALEEQAMRGKQPDADAIDAVSLRAAEHSFSCRLAAVRFKIDSLDQMLEDVDKTMVQSVANSLAGDVRELRASMTGIRFAIDRIESGRARVGRGDTRARRELRRKALTEAEKSLGRLAEVENFEELSKRVRDEVADAQIRALIGEILLLIGTSVLSAGIAGAVGGATRGVMLARTTGNAARLVAATPRIRLASGAVQLGGEAALNAAFQTLLSGDAMGSAFAENLLADGATLVALAPLRRLITRVGAADEAVKGLWQKAGRAGKLALRNAPLVTAEMIIGAAASYAAHMAVRGRPDSPEDVTGWVVQGASMAVGRFVAGRMTGLIERMENVAERGAFLKTQAAQQRKRAEQVEKSGDQAQALDLLAAQKELLDQESTLLSALEKDPTARDNAGLSAEQLALLRTANTDAQTHMAGPAYDELPFRLERLEEIVPGARWSGDPDQIKNALESARRADVPVEIVRHDAATGRWDILLRGRPMVLDEKPGGRKPRAQENDRANSKTDKDAAPHRTPSDDQERDPFAPDEVARNLNRVAWGEPGYNAVVGFVNSERDGIALLQRLMQGDARALDELGLARTRSFRSSTREWGLGLWNGKYVIVAGEPYAVDWSTLGPDMVPIAHSHPIDLGRKHFQGGRRMDFRALRGGTSDVATDKDLVFPSPADVRYVVMKRLDRHLVSVPYEHVGGNQIALLSSGGTSRTQLVFELDKGRFAGGVFTVRATVRAGKETLWTGDLHAVFPEAGKPQVLFSPPGAAAVGGAGAGRSAHRMRSGDPGESGTGGSEARDPSAPAALAIPDDLADHASSHGPEAVRWAIGTLPHDEAKVLLGKLSRPAIDALREVPATSARRLLDVFGSDLLEKVAVPVGGRRLATEVELAGPETGRATIEAAARKGKFDKIKRHADNMDAARTTIGGARALEDGSLIVDSQVMIGVRKLVAGESWNDLSAQEQLMVNRLRARAGMDELKADPPARDLKSLIGEQDLRAGNVGLGEIGSGTGTGGLELTVSRTDPLYTAMLAELAKGAAVGGSSGAADRAVVADAIFARTKGNDPPTLMSGDIDVYNRLARRYAPGRFKQRTVDAKTERLEETIRREAAGGFVVRIPDRNGLLRPLKIIPL